MAGKRLMKLLFVILFFLHTSFAYADFYENVGLGQYDFEHYSGPLNPEMKHSTNMGALEFADDIFEANYLAPVTSQAIFEWEKTWFSELPTQSTCPNSYMAENIEYIRYLYRLLTISYLYESLKDYQDALYGFGESSQKCSISYDVLFRSCRPKTDEMKKFLGRAKSVLAQDLKDRNLYRYEEKTLKSWLFRVRNTDRDLTPAQGRVRGLCELFGNCESLDEKTIVKHLSNACNAEKTLLQNICSETDEIYGLSRLPELVPILADSNVLKVINSGGHGEACLARYAKLLALKERWHPPFEWILPAVKNKLTFGDARYPQGLLFVAGALREFDERGLSDFLFVEPTPLQTATPTPIVAVLPTPIATATPIFIPKPKQTPAAVALTPKPTPTAKPLSAFEYALSLHLNGRDPINVDMNRFSIEGRFSAKQIERLRDPLKQYQTQKALQTMKKVDKLGSFKVPIRLMFLKYLIDDDQHQGLWNIVNVIGDTFYVVNDLEGKKSPVWVKLSNDRATDYRWQITIQVYEEKK